MREVPIHDGMVEGYEPGKAPAKPEKAKWETRPPVPKSELEEGVEAGIQLTEEQLRKQIEEDSGSVN